MNTDKTNELGSIHIDHNVFATIAGQVAVETQGVAGMASRQRLKDGVIELLNKENNVKGIDVSNNSGDITVDLYIIVKSGYNMRKLSYQLQEDVANNITFMTGITINDINIFIKGVDNTL